jgi:hypothetical protein
LLESKASFSRDLHPACLIGIMNEMKTYNTVELEVGDDGVVCDVMLIRL